MPRIPFRADAAFRRGSSTEWTYSLEVIALEECPKARLIVSIPTLCEYISVAAV